VLTGALCALAGTLLMVSPLAHYLTQRRVEEWMIYRFLVSSLAAQVALLLFAASVIHTRIAAIAMYQEVHSSRGALGNGLRSVWFWPVVAILVCFGGALVWPSALELWRTGGTHLHWSHFVVAMGCFNASALLCVIWGIDRVLDLVEARVRYWLHK
jgi:hypothetical protein